MKRLMAVGVTVAVLFVGVAAYHLLRDHNGKPEVTVTLTPGVAGCVPSINEVIGGPWLKKVTWNITNNCPAAQIVTMQDFVKDNDGKKTTDRVQVFSDDPVVSQPVNNGRTEQLKSRITKFVLVTSLYHYTICTNEAGGANRRCIDPDVEIWP